MKTKKSNYLEISNLSVSFDTKQILYGVSMRIPAAKVTVVMGPNGSGKSTLANALLGSPMFGIHEGSAIRLDGVDVSRMDPDERARHGLYLAFQSPIAIPGVSVMNLLRASYQVIHPNKTTLDEKEVHNSASRRGWKGNIPIIEFAKRVREWATKLEIEETMLLRSVHDGFSGGEKKKIEMLQALVLAPKYAVFDEIDTGLDVDALQSVAAGISELVKTGTGVLVITHYQRILNYLNPDAVYILVKGRVAAMGGGAIIADIEAKGYSSYG